MPDPKVNLKRKKTIPMVGAPRVKAKPVVKKKVVKKKVKTVIKKEAPTKNIINTKLKNIPNSLKRKVKGKLKNLSNSTPTEVFKKGLKFVNNYSPISATTRAVNKKVKSVIKNRRKK